MTAFKTMALTAVLALSAAAAGAGTVLIHGEAGPNRGARAAAIQWFADQIAERSGGEMRLDVNWGGALFKSNAALQSIGDGVVDMGTVIAVYYPQEFVSYGIADLPLDNPDAWVGMRATDELFRTNEAIRADLADKNLVYLGTFTTSQVNIGCKGTTIENVTDIDGLKVRGVGAYGKVFGALGANLVPMSIYDAYQGLDSGLIDCSQGYSYAVAALKQAEVMTSYTLLNWGQVGGLGTFMNKDRFDALPEDQQALLLQAGSDMVDVFGEKLIAANAKAVEDMHTRGLEVVEMPADQRAILISKGRAYVDDWVAMANAAGLDGAAILAEYRALLGKYTALRDAEGYPWARN